MSQSLSLSPSKLVSSHRRGLSTISPDERLKVGGWGSGESQAGPQCSPPLPLIKGKGLLGTCPIWMGGGC